MVTSIFNTLFNDTKDEYRSIYEPYTIYSLKNKNIISNFEKRAKNEQTLYGWFDPKLRDEYQIDITIKSLKEKGLEKIENEIMVSPSSNYL